MANISPGVYTKIIDLSTYVAAVPSTIGLICALTEKGEDNVLKFKSSRSELISEYGEPNIATYGKAYGQGLYCAYNYLGESGALYFMRCLPDDAGYANLMINGVLGATDNTASITLTYVSDPNNRTKSALKTQLETAGDVSPLCILYPIGRGEYYNGLGVRITEYSNPLESGINVLDIYERQSDGSDVIIESFEVSFDPKTLDSAGESMWIEYVLETYSAVLRADMTLTNGNYTGGYDLLARVYDKDIGDVSVVETALSATLTDTKQDFSDWESPLTGNAAYVVVAKDGKGNELWGFIGPAAGANSETIQVYDTRDLTTANQSWVGNITVFDSASTITYEVRQSNTSVASAFVGASTIVPLKKGSEGSLKDGSGNLDTAEATQLLSNGYAGTIDEDMLDTEETYFTLVFDCGYPTDVKTQIATLVTTRRDCVAILDNGDNASYTASMNARQNNHVYNTYYAALYEEYNKVYDIFTGQDVWFSPIYHMSYLLPRNDTVAEIFYAAAGFNRASIDTIKELRFNPRLAQRDQMYLKQLNPIVKFNEGYTMWGNLTTQARASALQDLNIVRLVLYCKRALERYCRGFIFEMNNAITWDTVAGDIGEFLEGVKRKQGLYDYNIEVSATDYERKRKTFHVNVTLEPTRVVEKIELNFFIK